MSRRALQLLSSSQRVMCYWPVLPELCKVKELVSKQRVRPPTKERMFLQEHKMPKNVLQLLQTRQEVHLERVQVRRMRKPYGRTHRQEEKKVLR